jgi:hypothetical protein
VNKETLAQLNCDFSVLSSDNLEAHLSFLKQSLRLRTRLIGKPGIVDREDPQLIVQSTIKPLWPTFAPNDYTTVMISSGRAVTPAGDIVELAEYQTAVGVAGLTDGVESVILLQYSEVDSDEIGYSTDGIATSVGRVPVARLSCVTKADFLDPTVTTAEVIDNSVVLGVVQWAETEAPKIVTTQESGYEWNRPWFSPRDVEHRNQVGTGEVTYTNPHGTSINDLAAGAGTHVYDHLTSTGMIWSKDSSVPGIPGILCYDRFDSSTIRRDNTSTKTEGSWFSTFGVLYVELSRYPTSIHKAVDGVGDEIVLDHIRGTRICVLVTDKAVTDLTVHYTATDTLAISSISPSAIAFKQIQAPDIAIAQGQACTTVLVPTVPLRKYSLVPREIMFKLSSAGQVFADPSVLLAARGVASSAGADIDVSAKLPVPGAVGIGLMGLPAVLSAACVFVVTGVDKNGTQVSETLYFDNNVYADAGPVPAETEAPTQVQYTKQIFASVTSILIPDSGDDAYDSVGSATFIVLGRADYTDSKATVLATGFWDGQQLVKVRDARRILPVVKDGFYGYSSLVQSAEILPGVNNVLGVGNRAQLIVAEDFAQPNYLDATTTTWDGLGILDVPVISPNLAVSDKVLRCYRSRAIPMRVDPAAPLRMVITLFGADGVVNTAGCVRVVGVHRSGRIAEAIAVPVADDNTGSVFAVFDNVPWSALSFVISGRCSGFAAYFLRPVNSDPDYFVEFV